MKPTAVSLFCGAGGCSLGFRQAGYNILYASDVDAKAMETYRLNFPDTVTDTADIGSLNFKEVLRRIGLRSGELDILIGGPPCQGFSTAGKRFWKDPRNRLLAEYVKAIDVVRPKWFLMENVEGLLTSNKGEYVFEAAKAFIDLGYQVRIEKVYSQSFGVPQRRKRVLIVGNRLGYDYVIPEATMHVGGKIFRNSDVTLRHAISALPAPATEKNKKLKYKRKAAELFEKYLRGDAEYITDHYFTGTSDLQRKRIVALMPGQTMKDLPEELQHKSFHRRANRRVMDGTPSEKRGGSPSGLKRLLFDEPSLTITGAATRELIHPVEDRPLTLREAARVQTFPDSFAFCGNASEKIQQIGNAIPPMIAKICAEHIANDYGFVSRARTGTKGRLLGYKLTKASAMSPALKTTDTLLSRLTKESSHQIQLFAAGDQNV